MFPVGFLGGFFEGGMPTWGFNIGIYILTCFKWIFGGGVFPGCAVCREGNRELCHLPLSPKTLEFPKNSALGVSWEREPVLGRLRGSTGTFGSASGAPVALPGGNESHECPRAEFPAVRAQGSSRPSGVPGLRSQTPSLGEAGAERFLQLLC